MAEYRGSLAQNDGYRPTFEVNIQVEVGAKKRKFVVHRDIICSRSEFFKAACSREWTDLRETKTIQLVDDTPHIFDIYLYCVYRNKVDVGDLRGLLEGEGDNHDLSPTEAKYRRLVLTYILADKMADTVTANMVIDAIIEHSDNVMRIPAASMVKLALSEIGERSLLQRLFLDYYVREATYDNLKQLAEDSSVPASFTTRILLERAKLEDDNPNMRISDIFPGGFTSDHKCRYHRHDDEHPCCGDGCERKVEDREKDVGLQHAGLP